MDQGIGHRDGKDFFLGGSLLTICLFLWCWALFIVKTDMHQGDVYRIIYLHVPCAFSAFFCSLILFIFSLKGLKGDEKSIYAAKASAEIGLLLTVCTLLTGSIWGKPTWGVWWTWDARLTTTFILALLYCGFLLLYSTMDDGNLRRKACSILGILIFADVPIIYKSVSWWRTLHQPPSLLREGGPSMATEFFYLLISCCLATLLLTFWMIFQRTKNIKLENSLLEKSFVQLAKQEADNVQ